MARNLIDPAGSRALETALRSQLQGDVYFDKLTRLLYSTDASMYQMLPVAVVVPKSKQDVITTVKIAAEGRIPILARGSASSLAGQTVANAIVIDFTKYLDTIVEVDTDQRWARVQPGVILDDLNRRVAAAGLMVGPDPASSNRATLGGMVANNATGAHSILYGNMIRHVISMDVVLADGSELVLENLSTEQIQRHSSGTDTGSSIIAGLEKILEDERDVIEAGTSKHWRRNSGYRLEALIQEDGFNPAHLMCGSEGTLGIITEITVGLIDKPQKTGLALVHFHTRREALEAVANVLSTSPSAIELFDGATIEQCRKMAGIAERMSFIHGEPGAVLMTEYSGSSAKDIDRGLVRLNAALANMRQGYETSIVRDPEEISGVWAIRKEALGFIMGVRGDYKPLAFVEDASVPVEHLPDYVDELDAVLVETRTPVVYYAHASAGCLHVRPFINLKDRSEIDKMHRIASASVDLVRKYGGAVSSEHGDGLARSEFNRSLVGDSLYEVYRKVKRLFDPFNIMNPGKIVDAPPMTDNLRLGESYEPIHVRTSIDFSDDNGFAGAIEQCSGVGTCRKMTAGTMCPSFMVTRDEIHSTRGRANALRSALAGDLEKDSLTSADMYQVMDLCIQCKACKSECPSNVDMARIKSEWLNQYWKANKLPSRVRFFAEFPKVASRLPAKLRGVSNRVASSRITGSILKKALGVASDRSLPAFARHSFQETFKPSSERSGPPIVVFADTFTNYNSPEIGHAAVELLSSIGYSVFVPQQRMCCGRTYMSKGLVEHAQSELLASVELLYEYASSDIPILMLEPSCLSMFTDDIDGLLPGEVRAKTVARASLGIEELAANDQFGLFEKAGWRSEQRGILVHGHCHQKALGETRYLSDALRHVTGSGCRILDSGCCGMAGSFGYEAEHQDVSIKMANRVLVPEINGNETDLVVAAGTSCRSQIKDLTGRKALHPAELLRNCLAT
ncbi:MAG: FAD-binding protein [Rhodothermales bacterium]|nr:FAD-binding protein [Rhodothermales bacterium]